MMRFFVEEKKLKEIRDEFQKISLYSGPYQKYEMAVISSHSAVNMFLTHTTVRFFVVYYDNGQECKVALIAPLRIYKNCAKVLGCDEHYNMSDFVYDTKDCSFLEDAIFAVLEYVKGKYYSNNSFPFVWQYLDEKSLSWLAISNLVNAGKLKYISNPEKVINVKIPLKEDYDAYFMGLSKHARQNVRTAYNRIKRDNCELSVHFYHPANGVKEKKEAGKAFKEYTNVYLKRLEERYHRKGVSFFAKKFLMKYLGHGRKTALSPMSLLVDVSLNGEVAAYAKCYSDLAHTGVTVPTLAIDLKWGFYSPGIVLVNELVKYLIDNGGVENLLMGRGEEPYKYEMGGEQYITYNFQIADCI